MRNIVYVAGPFRSYKNISEEENRNRAEKVGRFCQKLGGAPIVPHSSIFNGVYGDESIEEEREAGIETTLEITEFVAKDKDSEIWVIANRRFRSGSVKLSEGTKQEVALWTNTKQKLGYSVNVKIKTYEEWLKEMELNEFCKKGDSFSEIIKVSHNKDVFVQFSATWCGPCKAYTENVKKVEAQHNDRYSFFKIDIDDHPNLVKEYQIRGVPKTVIISKGSVKDEFTGVKTVSDLNKLLG